MCDDKKKALDDAKQAVKDFAAEMLAKETALMGLSGVKTGLETIGGKGSKVGGINNTLLGMASAALSAALDIKKLQELAKKVKSATDALNGCNKDKQKKLDGINIEEFFCMLDCGPCPKKK